jgi:hypothetical protein
MPSRNPRKARAPFPLPKEIEDRQDLKKETPLSTLADRKQAFLDNFIKWGTHYHTAKAIGVDAPTVSGWKHDDPEFKKAVDALEMVPIYMIERSAMRRAIEGKSDVLSIFMLKSRMPEKYGERQKQEIEITIHNVMTSQFVALIRQTVPDTCPHCQSFLGLTGKLAQELNSLSARLDPEGHAIATRSPQPE